MGLRIMKLGSGPCSVSNVLCDIEEVTQLLWVLIHPSINQKG